jgi:hypothetical protein
MGRPGPISVPRERDFQSGLQNITSPRRAIVIKDANRHNARLHNAFPVRRPAG